MFSLWTRARGSSRKVVWVLRMFKYKLYFGYVLDLNHIKEVPQKDEMQIDLFSFWFVCGSEALGGGQSGSGLSRDDQVQE